MFLRITVYMVYLQFAATHPSCIRLQAHLFPAAPNYNLTYPQLHPTTISPIPAAPNNNTNYPHLCQDQNFTYPHLYKATNLTYPQLYHTPHIPIYTRCIRMYPQLDLTITP